jgi:hypothetical protein
MHNLIGSQELVKQKVPILGTFCFFFAIAFSSWRFSVFPLLLVFGKLLISPFYCYAQRRVSPRPKAAGFWDLVHA